MPTRTRRVYTGLDWGVELMHGLNNYFILQGGTSSILTSGKHERVLTESLINLQEVFLQTQKVCLCLYY